MRPDPSRQAEVILKAAPTASLVRRDLIKSLVREGRWAEALIETETHHRQYPGDRAGLAEIAQILRAANRARRGGAGGGAAAAPAISRGFPSRQRIRAVSEASLTSSAVGSRTALIRWSSGSKCHG
jgi:hypothetical protein